MAAYERCRHGLIEVTSDEVDNRVNDCMCVIGYVDHPWAMAPTIIDSMIPFCPVHGGDDRIVIGKTGR